MCAVRSQTKTKSRSNGEQRQARTRCILYPEFLEASKYEDDVYWKRALTNASYGEFGSKMVLYIDGRLTRKDSPTSSIKVPKNPESVARVFVRFLKKYERIISNQELQKQLSVRHEVCSRHVILTWNNASLQMRRAALNHYAIRTCDSMIFDSETKRGKSVRDLSSTLFTAMGMKLLTKDTVEMSNNIIVDVTCVRYDEEYNSWVLIQPRSKYR